MKDILFLTLAEVVEIHADQVRRYGGQAGVRDMGLLESALAMPESSFGGTYLHEDIFAMAGAYAFHLCGNHPFYDGNKRTALASALVFLRMNGYVLHDAKAELYQVMMDVANSRMTKEQLGQVLKRLASKKKT